jgi:hypothetical protein
LTGTPSSTPVRLRFLSTSIYYAAADC